MSELKKKILDSISSPQLISFATITEDGKPWVRYVIGMADENLIIRFSTFIKSRKVAQIEKNQEVHIVCGVSSLEAVEHYIQIQGKAEITVDEEERKKFWHDDLKAYFSGSDDPNYCVCMVKPYRIEYYTMGSMEPEVWEE
jgi:general stress protein 26